MTVMEVCHYGKFDIELFFHRFLPFPNFFVPMENFLREIVTFNFAQIKKLSDNFKDLSEIHRITRQK